MHFLGRNICLTRTFPMPHLHDERVVLATGPEVVDLWDTLVAADLLVEEEFNV